MTLELVYSMRTCSAALLDSKGAPSAKLICDTVQALLDASNLLEEPIGEPMAVLGTQNKTVSSGVATWTTGTLGLPTVTAKPCPSCGSIDARKATVKDRHVTLTCPRCEHQWEYGRG